MNPSSALRLDQNPVFFTGSTHYKLHTRAPPLCRPSRVSGTFRKTFQCCSVAVSEKTRESPSRIGELSQVSGVLGCQWGDEGKGKLVDILAQHFDVVARCQVLSLSLLNTIFLPFFIIISSFCIVFFMYICIVKFSKKLIFWYY